MPVIQQTLNFERQQDIVRDGLVLRYDVGNPKSYAGIGTNCFDLSGNGNNGTLFNGTSYTNTGGGGFVFDGDNDFVDIQENNNMTPQILTWDIGFRVNNDLNTIGGVGNSAYQFLIFRQNTTANIGQGHYIAYNEVDDRIELTLFDSTITAYTIFTPKSSIPIHQNCIITGVIKQTTTELYLNGNFVTSGSKYDGIQYGTGDTLKLGKISSGSSYEMPFNGNIYFFNMYNRALSSTEVKQNFSSQRKRLGL